MPEQVVGYVLVKDKNNKHRIRLDANQGDIWVKNTSGKVLFHFDSTYAALWLGGQGNEGDLIVKDGANKERIKLDGGEGDIRVKTASGQTLFHFDSAYAALYVGGQGNEGDVIVRDGTGKETIKLDGGSGDILLQNADAAEEFETAEHEAVLPGTVMVLAEDGRVTPCGVAYDRKVVGVVSGAGPYRPGIVLDRKPQGGGHRVPISMIGKVACRVDASYGAVDVGDLLTSSPTSGCAMRASDREKAFGAVLGKAMTPHTHGIELVRTLVSVQ